MKNNCRKRRGKDTIEPNIRRYPSVMAMRCDAFSLEAHLRQISRSMEESTQQIKQHKNPEETDFIHIGEALEMNGVKRLKAK